MGSSLRRPAAEASSSTARYGGRNSCACSARVLMLRAQERPSTTHSRRRERMAANVLPPMEPVEPRMTTRRFCITEKHHAKNTVP